MNEPTSPTAEVFAIIFVAAAFVASWYVIGALAGLAVLGFRAVAG